MVTRYNYPNKVLTSQFSISLPSSMAEDLESPPDPHPNTPTSNPTTHTQPTKLPSRPRKKCKLSNTSATRITNTCITNTRIIPRSLSEEGELEKAIRYLKSSDPLLIPLIETYPPPILELYQPPFLALTKSILFQQLAYKAGSSIYNRFISLCGHECNVVPDFVLNLTPLQLRQIGVSSRKASYLHDLAKKYIKGILSDEKIVLMDDKSLFTMLTMVNGIGSWSVHMFMIFSLHRLDVLPVHDQGIRRGVQMLYALEEVPRPSRMDQLCEKWRPYRSVASWYIWRYFEAKGELSKGVVVEDSDVSLEQQQHLQFLDPINNGTFCF